MIQRGSRTARVAALAGLFVAGCGGTQVLAVARPRLGVQSNEGPVGPVLLRVRPAAGLRLRTTSEASGDATFLGREVHFDYVATEDREVLERRADGTTVISSRRTGGSMRLTLAGRPREETLEAEPSPSTSVMDERGRSIDDGMFASPTGDAEGADMVRRLLDPVLDALTYPDHPLAIGERWQARGTEAIAEAEARGTLRYELAQELVRVEGSGATAVAVLAFRGEVSGDGLAEANPLTGLLRFEGAYTVGLQDGLVRSMQTRAEGSFSIGSPEAGDLGAMLEVPFRGTLHYRAE